jgi:hypothetical protein
MNHGHPTTFMLNDSPGSIVKLISELNKLANQTRVRITGISLLSRRDGKTRVSVTHSTVHETHDNILYNDFDFGKDIGFRDIVKRINSVANDSSVKIVNIVFGLKGKDRRHMGIHAKKMRR